jgi:hypothetical protein
LNFGIVPLVDMSDNRRGPVVRIAIEVRRQLSSASVLACAALAVVPLGGCHGQVEAKGQMSASAQVDDDRKYEVQEAETPIPPGVRPPPAPTPVPTAAPVDRTYYLGVAHDLSLSPSATRAATCRCLAVGFGAPTDPKFAWQAGPPPIDPGTIAVAIAADGVPCSSPGYAPLRASIAAVESDADNNIVLVVENVREGQPRMRGALVGVPGGKGTLLVRARKGAPYGAPPGGGAGPCRIAFE